MVGKRSVLETPLFHKIYDLYKLLCKYHATVPKAHRYTLWQKCETETLNLLELLIATSHYAGKDRLSYLLLLSQKLDLLKVLFRLAKETRAIDTKQYVSIQSFLHEIGKMIGGWLKSVSH